MAVKTQIIDKGWERIKREMKLLDNSFTKVGVQQDTLRDDLSDQLVVAFANEFGTKNIPARPFVRATVDLKKQAIFSLQRKMYENVVLGRMSTLIALKAIGEYTQRQMQRYMKRLKTPVNAPSTQRRKGKRKSKKAGFMINNPLVDTGNLVQSIRHVEVIK